MSSREYNNVLGCLILTWNFYERSPLIRNGYHCWQVSSFKPPLPKFELNPFISLQVTVSENNQPPNFLQRWKKVNFMFWFKTTFCVEKPYEKPRLSSINIIRTLLRRMKWFRSGLSNFALRKRFCSTNQNIVVLCATKLFC